MGGEAPGLSFDVDKQSVDQLCCKVIRLHGNTVIAAASLPQTEREVSLDKQHARIKLF